MEIFVKALPVEDVVGDLAKQFRTNLEKDAGELILRLPQELGQGYIRATSFSSGVGIIEYYCTFFKDIEIHFISDQTHPLKFIFCSEGKVDHSFQENSDVHTIDTYQNVIVSSSGHNGHVLFFKANETAHVSSLEIIREDFKKRRNYDFKGLEPRLKELFEDSVAEKIFFYQGNYSIQAADIVEEINNKEITGFLRNIFLEGKAYEMLAKQINQYHDDMEEQKGGVIVRRSDVEQVKQAVELIKRDLNKNYSVDHLAKEVGTNVNKLQIGFKYMFNLTVNKYMQQVKLEAAKDLLTGSDHNISQIVSMIGLNNRSYFSKIFKEKYGVSPKYFLQNKNVEHEQIKEEATSAGPSNN
jgi:AraC-like DNA-binding protein